MSLQRQNRFDLKRRYRQVHPEPIPPPVASSDDMERVNRRVTEELQVRARIAERRGVTKPVDLSGSVDDLWTNAQNQPVDVVSFTAPPGSVFEVTGAAIVFSEPIFNSGRFLGWRFAVNGARVPYVGEQGQDWVAGSYGTLTDPVQMRSVTVVQGSTFSIQAAVLSAFFEEFVVVTGRLMGRLLDVGGGRRSSV